MSITTEIVNSNQAWPDNPRKSILNNDNKTFIPVFVYQASQRPGIQTKPELLKSQSWIVVRWENYKFNFTWAMLLTKPKGKCDKKPYLVNHTD